MRIRARARAQIASEYFHPINGSPDGVANEIRNVVVYISRRRRTTAAATASPHGVKCQRDRDAFFCRRIRSVSLRRALKLRVKSEKKSPVCASLSTVLARNRDFLVALSPGALDFYRFSSFFSTHYELLCLYLTQMLICVDDVRHC